MSGINLQKFAHSFTRSVLLNTGRRLHACSSSGDVKDQDDADDETPASSSEIQKTRSGILNIPSRIGLTVETGLKISKSSPYLQQANSFSNLETLDNSKTSFTVTNNNEEFSEDKTKIDDSYFPKEESEMLTFTVPARESGTMLFK